MLISVKEARRKAARDNANNAIKAQEVCLSARDTLDEIRSRAIAALESYRRELLGADLSHSRRRLLIGKLRVMDAAIQGIDLTLGKRTVGP